MVFCRSLLSQLHSWCLVDPAILGSGSRSAKVLINIINRPLALYSYGTSLSLRAESTVKDVKPDRVALPSLPRGCDPLRRAFFCKQINAELTSLWRTLHERDWRQVPGSCHRFTVEDEKLLTEKSSRAVWENWSPTATSCRVCILTPWSAIAL